MQAGSDEHLWHWGRAAFIARCARRYAEFFSEDSAEPSVTRTVVVEAVRLAEASSALGGNLGVRAEGIEFGGTHYDNYDIVSIHEALTGFRHAAENTFADLADDPSAGPHAAKIVVAITLASLSIEAAFPEDFSVSQQVDVDSIVNLALSCEPSLRAAIEWDLATLNTERRRRASDVKSGMSPDAFGPLWQFPRPSSWPRPRLVFRPRARIIRTIGDRLISGPEAAVIELVKNSYDADATVVKITFFPPFISGEGQILVEDNGHGMSLLDIQEKWMEPATSDKRERKRSPHGRKLLGSKGIGRFAAARLGAQLQLVSTIEGRAVGSALSNEQTRIPNIVWSVFDEARYLDNVSFAVETGLTSAQPGTSLLISELRDEWSAASMARLHHELRRLVSPLDEDASLFRIVLDLSRCTREACGFAGDSIFDAASLGTLNATSGNASDPYEVKPFPVLDACDYSVDGIFDENGLFEGTMAMRRTGREPDVIKLQVPFRDGDEPCGIVLVKLSIFDREATSIRSTAQVAGFGSLGVRDARKLLDSIAGIAIYREGFRIRPYGDAENDWLTLDAKRVQNPSLKIGRNQVAGIVVIDDEETSKLLERSSREGLEENGSFRRLQALILTLLAEVIEPRRRAFRISAGLEVKKAGGFREVLSEAELPWTKALLDRLPEGERAEAKKLVDRESGRLTGYLKDLEARQAQLEAQVTLGSIIGEVMHQGNTPLAFIETEVARLRAWWPRLFEDSNDAREDRDEVPKILRGMTGSASALRTLFKALSPLSGARRGEPRNYAVQRVLDETIYLFKTKAEHLGLQFSISSELNSVSVRGYSEDLSTAMTNLIDNSIHWLDHHKVKQPRISINAVDIDSETVEVHVQDNGVGIPEEFRDQLFDVGFSLKPNGTGLGLSIAREAIYRSGGELHLVPTEVGARFAMTLPRGHESVARRD